MADFRPFRAIRYNQRAVGPLDSVISPPYDVVSGDLRERLYQASAWNIVRVESPMTDPVDPHACYRQAAECLTAWRRDGVLLTDELESYYVHRMTWDSGEGLSRVTGLMGIMRVEPYEAGWVLPHENTLPEPRRDRLNLLRATRTHTSPVYGIYRDTEGTVERNLEPWTRREPSVLATGLDGVTHEVWRLTDPGVTEEVRRALLPIKVVIADGHHRYETALAFVQEGGTNGAAFVLMTLINVASQAPWILPTHRMVRLQGGPAVQWSGEGPETVGTSVATWLKGRLADRFSVSVSAKCRPCAERRGAAPAGRGPGRSGGRGEFPGGVRFEVVAIGESGPEGFMATLKAHEREELAGEGPLADVDAFVFQKTLMPLLFENPGQAVREGSVEFTRDEKEVWDRVAAGTFSAGFLLRGCSAERVMACALAGKRMPQKSTYFHPKLPAGLVCFSVD